MDFDESKHLTVPLRGNKFVTKSNTLKKSRLENLLKLKETNPRTESIMLAEGINLPEEILHDIMLKLDTQSVINFTSTCKSLYNIMTPGLWEN